MHSEVAAPSRLCGKCTMPDELYERVASQKARYPTSICIIATLAGGGDKETISMTGRCAHVV
jgi:hypothetical protein